MNDGKCALFIRTSVSGGIVSMSQIHGIVSMSQIVSMSVSIKYGLRTADNGLRTGYKIRTRYKTRTGKYGLGIKHGLGIKYGLRTTLVKTLLIGSR